ncbi:unnamed protein product, partial [Oppiella nova]
MRNLSESLFMGPIVSFDKYSSVKDYSDKYVTSFTSIGDSLPESVHLLTLEKWSENEVLLRLEDQSETSDKQVSHEINLQKMLKTLTIVGSVETNLVANELLSETKRLDWKSKLYNKSFDIRSDERTGSLAVTLTPQQIRTFILTINNTYHKEAKCTYSWVTATQTTIPGEAYVAGYDADKTPLNICRHKVNDDIIAGKADKQ